MIDFFQRVLICSVIVFLFILHSTVERRQLIATTAAKMVVSMKNSSDRILLHSFPCPSCVVSVLIKGRRCLFVVGL